MLVTESAVCTIGGGGGRWRAHVSRAPRWPTHEGDAPANSTDPPCSAGARVRTRRAAPVPHLAHCTHWTRAPRGDGGNLNGSGEERRAVLMDLAWSKLRGTGCVELNTRTPPHRARRRVVMRQVGLWSGLVRRRTGTTTAASLPHLHPHPLRHAHIPACGHPSSALLQFVLECAGARPTRTS